MIKKDDSIQEIMQVFEGMTSREIAEFLEERKIKGKPACGYECPLAVYLMGHGITVWIDRNVIRTVWEEQGEKYVMPPNLRAFVSNFDYGIYPELIDNK